MGWSNKPMGPCSVPCPISRLGANLNINGTMMNPNLPLILSALLTNQPQVPPVTNTAASPPPPAASRGERQSDDDDDGESSVDEFEQERVAAIELARHQRRIHQLTIDLILYLLGKMRHFDQEAIRALDNDTEHFKHRINGRCGGASETGRSPGAAAKNSLYKRRLELLAAGHVGLGVHERLPIRVVVSSF